MFWKISIIISCLKFLMIPSYRSTDFEVHRNWMAIVHSLPLGEWYLSCISQWTLDYPPLFAWMEKGFSYIAFYVDPHMLELTNLDYASFATIIFQRITVITTDFVLVYSIIKYVEEYKRKSISKHITSGHAEDYGLVMALLIMTNVGLLIVDHIHFQYNGILFGIMILSILRLSQGHPYQGAFWFCILLNMKHIFLYIAPAYGVFLLRDTCFKSIPGGRIQWTSFSKKTFFLLAGIVLLVFTVSFGPFILKGQMLQVLSRLFPFKRGLCHAYWAPNFWALCNIMDKGLAVTGRRLGLLSNLSSASMTGGLVQEFDYSVLPSVKPYHTFLLTALSMLPALLHTWLYPKGINGFIQCLSLCAFSAFMFGWHVHEKAVLLIVIPLILLSLEQKRWAKIFLLLSTVGHYSLFPLVFTPAESVLKYGLFLIYTIFGFYSLGRIHGEKWNQWYKVPLLTNTETAYLFGLIVLHVYNQCFHHLLRLSDLFPFLPLLLTSSYCAAGMCYLWINLYKQILFCK